MSYTYSQGVFDSPNRLNLATLVLGSAPSSGTFNANCHSSYTTTGDGQQAGVGYLPGEGLLAWIAHASVTLDVNGGSCVAGGSVFGPFGTSGVAPAVVGFNGHAYVAFTGTDSTQHINIVQAF
jgi:hypothetical protein